PARYLAGRLITPSRKSDARATARSVVLAMDIVPRLPFAAWPRCASASGLWLDRYRNRAGACARVALGKASEFYYRERPKLTTKGTRSDAIPDSRAHPTRSAL